MKKLFLTLLTLNCVNTFCAESTEKNYFELLRLSRQLPEETRQILSYVFSSYEAITIFEKLKLAGNKELNRFIENNFDQINKSLSLTWKESTVSSPTKLSDSVLFYKISNDKSLIAICTILNEQLAKTTVLDASTLNVIFETDGDPICISDDNRFIAVNSDNVIKIINIKNGHILNKDILTLQNVVKITKNFVVAKRDANTVVILSTETGYQLHLFQHNDYIADYIISPDQRYIAIMSYNETKIWDVNTGQLISTISTYCRSNKSITFSNDNNISISSGNCIYTEIYDLYGKPIKKFVYPQNPDEICISTTYLKKENKINVFDRNFGKVIKCIPFNFSTGLFDYYKISIIDDKIIILDQQKKSLEIIALNKKNKTNIEPQNL